MLAFLSKSVIEIDVFFLFTNDNDFFISEIGLLETLNILKTFLFNPIFFIRFSLLKSAFKIL